MRLLVSLVTSAVLLAAPAGAAAATVSPPGNSGITQYLEVVPTAAGGKPSKTAHGGSNPSPLSKQQQQQLAKAGADGKQLEQVVSATSPDGVAATPTPTASSSVKAKHHAAKRAGAAGSASTHTATTQTATTQQHTDASGKPVKERGLLATAFSTGGGGSGGGGLGIPLLVPMLIAAVAAGAFALGRRRGAAQDADPDLGA